MPIEEVERRFLKREGKSPVDKLNMAFHGAPPHVLPWFRVGQAVMMVLGGAATATDESYPMLLESLRLRFPEAEIDQMSGDQIVDLCRRHREALNRNDPQWLTKIQQYLATLAAQADREAAMTDSAESANRYSGSRLFTLMVLLGFALGGFALFQQQLPLATLWLLFFVIAVPPVWAVLFESHKLRGANIVQIYKIGVRSIPLISKLVKSS